MQGITNASPNAVALKDNYSQRIGINQANQNPEGQADKKQKEQRILDWLAMEELIEGQSQYPANANQHEQESHDLGYAEA